MNFANCVRHSSSRDRWPNHRPTASTPRAQHHSKAYDCSRACSSARAKICESPTERQHASAARTFVQEVECSRFEVPRQARYRNAQSNRIWLLLFAASPTENNCKQMQCSSLCSFGRDQRGARLRLALPLQTSTVRASRRHEAAARMTLRGAQDFARSSWRTVATWTAQAWKSGRQQMHVRA